DEILSCIRAACADGEQTYWVCPVIEDSKEGDLQTALDTFERLRSELKDVRVGLLHGRLAPPDKAAAMDAFARGETQLLACTTVIEVGVDVPNASLMVIESAERFGLAQLHQLRGRVGRGRRESHCILLFGDNLSDNARQRLKAIYENADGFKVAELDLALRGQGEFLGERQSGDPLFRFADLVVDGELAQLAKAAAAQMLREEPQAARAHLERWLHARRDLSQA
ncbi:MAG: helicase-related protein, partial [Betaproteobacteria bacterium]